MFGKKYRLISGGKVVSKVGEKMKVGLDYFPFTCYPDDKLELIEAEFGLKGLAIIVKLFQKIYGDKGYYCEWNNGVALLFGKKCGLVSGGKVVSEIIDSALKKKLFSEEIYNKYKVLTSAGIQRRYIEAGKRRSKIEIKEEYLLLKGDELPKNVYIISKNVYENEKNVYAMYTENDKVKESKVKKSKVKKTSCTEQSSAPVQEEAVISLLLNDKSLYPITSQQVNHWKELYPSVDIMQELRKMVGWIEANPKKRKTKNGISKFINSWLSKAQDKGGNNYGTNIENDRRNTTVAEKNDGKYGTFL